MMLTVTAFLSLQQTFSKHSADRSEPVPRVRIDGEASAAILEPIRSITDAYLLGLGRA
jgi:hypothetical protein